MNKTRDVQDLDVENYKISLENVKVLNIRHVMFGMKRFHLMNIQPSPNLLIQCKPP